jgi:hypothetical protein
MMFSKKKLDRRLFLQGVGVSVAMPFLDAMIPAMALPLEKKAPLRMGFCYVPNGIILDQWYPKVSEGADVPLPVEFPRVSKHFQPFRDDIIMFAGMTANGGRALGDGPGDHGRAGAGYLTASHPVKTAGKDIHAGVSVDQIAATRVGGQTQFSSLELGCEEGLLAGNCDSGYSCAYSNAISWRTPDSPLSPEVRPRAVFDRLFGSADFERDPVKRAQKAELRGSILDRVTGSASNLKNSMGSADKHKLDEYLFDVRDIEKRIQKIEAENKERPPAPFERPQDSIPENYIDHSQLMFDMMTVAYKTNATRVITMLMGVEYSGRAYREIGVPEGHHGLTHHLGDPEKIEKVTKINELHAKQFAYFLNKMKSTPDGDGSLLDHSMIVYGSALADGNKHQHDHLPTMIVGKANGTLKGGRFLTYPDETPIGNLWLSMLARMDINDEKVGDANGQLTNL